MSDLPEMKRVDSAEGKGEQESAGDKVTFITVQPSGNKVPIKPGQDKGEAIKEHFDEAKNTQENIGGANKQSIAAHEQPKTKQDFFGVEHKGYAGAAAIEKLLVEKSGHIKNAFHRSEVGGGIDLVWGTGGKYGGGLAHLIDERDSYLAQGKGTLSGIDMAKKLPEIIDNGKPSFHKKTGRLILEHNGFRVIISPEYHNEKINWVLTGMEIWK